MTVSSAFTEEAIFLALPYLTSSHPFRRTGCQTVSPQIRTRLWLDEDDKARINIIDQICCDSRVLGEPSTSALDSSRAVRDNIQCLSRCLTAAVSSHDAWSATRWWVRLVGQHLHSLRANSIPLSVFTELLADEGGRCIPHLHYLFLKNSRTITNDDVKKALLAWPLTAGYLGGVVMSSSLTPLSSQCSIRRLSFAGSVTLDADMLSSVLSALKETQSLEFLDLSNTVFSDKCLISSSLFENTPNAIRSLKELRISHCPITGAVFAVSEFSDGSFNTPLRARFPHLQALVMHRCVTFGSVAPETVATGGGGGAGQVNSARMPDHLVTLDVSGTMIDDDGITTLLSTGSAFLESLSLAHCYRLTELGLTALVAFTRLRVLDLTGASFSEHHGATALPLLARYLVILEELRMVDCSGIGESVLADALSHWIPRTISVNNVAPLLPHQQRGLSLLDLRCCGGVSDTMLHHLDAAHCAERHRTLSLVLARGGAQVNPVMLQQLGVTTLPFLSSLDLSECYHVTDEAIRRLLLGPPHLQLSSFPSTLTSLDLSQCFVGDGALQSIAASSVAQSLKFLSVEGNYKVTDAGLRTIGRHFPNVEGLKIGAATISDAGIAFLTPLVTKLKYLSLAGCTVNVTEMSLLELEPFLALETLDLLDCASLSRTACGEALAAISSLTSLSLAGCAQLDNECLAQMAMSVGARTNLRSLSVRHCPMITNSAVDSLLKLRALETLDTTATQVSMVELRKLAAALPQLCQVTPNLTAVQRIFTRYVSCLFLEDLIVV
ncbi:Hypothetical protein, putative [Bodo saltans]|uniref:Uncharacterized protein n=1 Tax=Bodo saltans TaxID=75058 RepID=A0A0S4JMP9_BODSA|nr:Hypothetical protein, putative [Bodo saltans]|eukprot:CUG91684.1 Hypothetical protein, putative [Bodo saltans]